jgi:DNA-binding MarR family transcriptional regulator
MFLLGDSLGYLVNRAALAMRWALDERLAEFDLTAPQWAILAALWEEDGQPLSTVGGVLGFDKPTTTGIVDRLEKKRLVRRSRDAVDRRITRVMLTRRGAALRHRLPSLAEDVNGLAAAGIAKADMEALKRGLRTVWKNLGY